MGKGIIWRSVAAAMLSALMALSPAGAKPVACPAEPIRLGFYEMGDFYTAGAGIDVDIVAELERRSGCRFATSVRPRARIWKEIESGDLEMTVSGIENDERSRFAWFYPYLRQKNHALIDDGAVTGVTSMQQFIAHPARPYWGVVRGFRHGDELDAPLAVLRAQDRVIEVVDAEHLFRLLVKRLVAGIYAQPLLFLREQRLGELPTTVRAYDFYPDVPGVTLHMVLSKKRFGADEAAAWGQLLARLRADGTVVRLLGRYLDRATLKQSLVTP